MRNNGKDAWRTKQKGEAERRPSVLPSSQVISRVPSRRLYLGRSENILEPVRRVSGPAAGTRTKCAIKLLRGQQMS
jgi:hypothetical protein